MPARNPGLVPIFCARSHSEFIGHFPNAVIGELAAHERSLAYDLSRGKVKTAGFCIPCNQTVPFLLDMSSGGQMVDGAYVPNWRERLICPHCLMSNRQRLIATLLAQQLESRAPMQNVYLMERTTPLYQWAARSFGDHSIVGSEYFGPGFQGGDIVGPFDYQPPLNFHRPLKSAYHKLILFYSILRAGGIRHEDITKLSFPDASLDLILSNDVFEHVPTPQIAFRECARVLRAGGQMLASIPFYSDRGQSAARAELNGLKVHHLLPPVYHGNPVSAEGSLVYTDFGWDIIQLFLNSGFSDAAVEVYGSAQYGHLGGGQIVFRLTK